MNPPKPIEPKEILEEFYVGVRNLGGRTNTAEEQEKILCNEIISALIALDAYYKQKFLEIVDESMPQGSYHVNTEELRTKIESSFSGGKDNE